MDNFILTLFGIAICWLAASRPQGWRDIQGGVVDLCATAFATLACALLVLREALWPPAFSWRFAFGVIGLLFIIAGATLPLTKQALAPAPGSKAALIESIRAFQHAEGLVVDGIVGPATLRKLYR